MSFSENKGFWIVSAAAVLAVVTLVWLLLSGGPTRIVVLFPDAGGLKREDPVLWHGYTVGKVEKIEPLVDNQVGVTVRLREDYTDEITRGSRFTLTRSALFGYVGRNAIEVETPAERSAPYAPGEHVQGISPPRPTVTEQARQAALKYWELARKEAADLTDIYRSSPYRADIDDALGQLRSLAELGAAQAQKGLEAFRRDHRPEIDRVLEKLEEARDWMRRQGDEPGADRLQQEIDRLKERLKDLTPEPDEKQIPRTIPLPPRASSSAPQS